MADVGERGLTKSVNRAAPEGQVSCNLFIPSYLSCAGRVTNFVNSRFCRRHEPDPLFS